MEFASSELLNYCWTICHSLPLWLRTMTKVKEYRIPALDFKDWKIHNAAGTPKTCNSDFTTILSHRHGNGL